MFGREFNFIYKPKDRAFTGKFSKLNEYSDEQGFFTSYELICEKTFGHTIGNSIRRSLLSNMSGYAPIAINLNNARHVFDTVPGIKETLMEIVMRIKKLVIYFEEDIDDICTIGIKGKKIHKVFGKDLEFFSDVKASVVNKNLHICTLDADVAIDLEIIVSKGYGYVASSEHEFSPKLTNNFFAIDSLFSPVLNCAYKVETQTGGREVFDRVIIDINTNGSVSPDEVIKESIENITRNLKICDTQQEWSEKSDSWEGLENADIIMNDHIEDLLELSPRTRNQLLKNGIETISDLLNNTEASLRVMPGLGDVAINEIVKFLLERGLYLGRNNSKNRRSGSSKEGF